LLCNVSQNVYIAKA